MSQSSAAEVARSPSAELRLRLQRERALVELIERGTKKGFGLWTARLYAFGVFVTYAIAICLARGSDRRAVIQGLLHAALVAFSWVGALAALGTTRILAQQAESDPLKVLALQRGFKPRAVLRARTLASALGVLRMVSIPALLLVAIALARGQSLAWALVTAPALVAYAAALGLCLALLAHCSAALSPRHPRALLAALVLSPWLISQAYPAIPNLPALLAALLERLLGVGSAFT